MLVALSHSPREQRSRPSDVPSPDSQDLAEILTPREREIAMLTAKGFSNKEIGQILDISHWTVAAHLKACFLKLGLRRRGELTYALRDLI